MTSRGRPMAPPNEPSPVDHASAEERVDQATQPSSPSQPVELARRPNRTGRRPRPPRRAAVTHGETPDTAAQTASAGVPGAAGVAPVAEDTVVDDAADTGVEVVGVVGDASPAATRGGEDVRRRGWFWHWNSIVTQYAPLIGLKGVGLLNSYTVWTDRREASPHRGYAFPSQQREAGFYGEDRAELITINKILVALDLIEIRKEMVLRTDERGRRWRVPHNFYRVKDHGDGFTLDSDAVLAVVTLADRDRAVYRYVRRIFSPRFAPIDAENVWGTILDELRGTDVWQRLAARTARDEDRASARSRAGHASRRAAEAAADPTFLLPSEGDIPTPEPTADDTTNDSGPVETTTGGQTSVATINTGLDIDVDEGNTGSMRKRQSSVDRSNSGGPTSVAPSNRTYHQENTTTTTDELKENSRAMADFAESVAELPPDDARDEATAVVRFEEANVRPSTPAERRLLRELARRFGAPAEASGATGWGWLAAAIDDAVAAGSAFVAPRRLREILTRWEREGLPPELTGELDNEVRSRDRRGKRLSGAEYGQSMPPSTRGGGDRSPIPKMVERGTGRGPSGTESGPPGLITVPSFVVAECGLSNRQVWSAVLDELRSGGDRASVDTWLRDAMIVGRGDSGDGGSLIIGLPHELARRRVADRFVTALRRAVTAVVGVALPVEVVLARDWLAAEQREQFDDATEEARASSTSRR